MRYFFHIGYRGTNYQGWQKLPQARSIQQIIETLLSQILKTPVTIVGCGRTDSEVHASQFFFHLDVNKAWDYDLKFRLNKNLPADIAIFDIIEVSDRAHARFDAFERTYDYFIHTYKDPFLSSVSALYEERALHLDKMKEAILLLTRYNDYRALCRHPDKHRTTICTVANARLFVDATGDRLRFTISANRFLSGMIRIIVQKLLMIGTGRLSLDEFEQYFILPQPPSALEPALPQGLYLSKVKYPFLDITPRTDFLKMVNGSGEWRDV